MVDLKEQFGEPKETVSILRQIRERTTAVEGWVSDLEDQLPREMPEWLPNNLYTLIIELTTWRIVFD